MKAAVLYQLASAPKYADFQDPIPQNTDQLVLTMKAASIKNIDKMRASGTHYASYTQLPTVVGMDGVGILEDGRRVYAIGITGMIAEKALIAQNNYTVLPDKIDDVMAAALPNAIIGSAMALNSRVQIKKGDTVLVNGATGVTGKLAVQVAKYYSAAKVIVTGRNSEALHQLIELGADEIVALNQSDEVIIKLIKDIHSKTPIDIVVDYLWGHPIELILTALKSSGLNKFTHSVRIVTVGEMAGSEIRLASSVLRSSAIELLGSGIGSLSKEAMQKYTAEVLPEMFQLATAGKLKLEIVTAELKDIQTAWQQVIPNGKRLVICI